MTTIDRRTVARTVAVLVLLAALAPFVVSAVPQAVGADHSYTVLSSSMSPHIKAGDEVLVDGVDPGSIRRGDVITFRPPSGEYGGATRVTHRVVGIERRHGERYFRTKGDANGAPDPDPVPASNVVGVVSLHIPKVGYVLTFAHTPVGLVALVFVPAALLALSEAYTLVRSDGEGE